MSSTTHLDNKERMFPFITTDDGKKDETIKWRSGNANYEIHIPMLDSIELRDLVPHCLSYRAKIEAAGTTAAQMGPTLFREFSRTLSMVLRPVWDQVLVDFPPPDNSVNSFEATLRHFIAAHATADDRHEAVQQIRVCKKPRAMTTQAFWYALREQNGYIAWLPGTEAPLDNNSFRQAYYDAMPQAWKDRFTSAGYSVGTRTVAEIARYMRNQEKLAVRKQQENTQQQRQASVARRNLRGAPKRDISRLEHGSDEPKHKRARRIENTDPCPLPGHEGHKWGKCRANAYNDERMSRRTQPKNGKKATTEVTMAQVVEKEQTPEEKEYVPTRPAINEEPKEDAQGMFIPQCFMSTLPESMLTESHYLDALDFEYQKSENSTDCETEDAFVAFCEEAYVLGDYEAELLVTNNNPLHGLKLRAVGIMRAGIVQGIHNKKLLKILFDTGSDVTLINRR